MTEHDIIGTKKPAQRSAALLSAGALAVTALVALGTPATAVVTQGPDRGDGLPAFFRDATGLAAAPCENVAVCIDPFDPADGVYFDAGADTTSISAVYSVGAGVEPVEGLLVDNVARFSENGPIANGRYTIRDPWGTRTCTAAGNRMDCRVLTGNPVKSLLRANVAPAGFLGDGEIARRFTGSPTGFNRIVITGPGGFRESTNLFTVLGQMPANTAMTSVGTDALTLGSITKSRPSAANIPVSSFGTADAAFTVSKGGANPAAFQVPTAASVASGNSANIRVTYTPRANRNVSAILTIDDNGLAAPRRVQLTGIAHDTLAPTVRSSNPARGATGVRPAMSVRVTFNEPVRDFRSGLSLVDPSGDRVAARVSRVRTSNTYVLNPGRSLDRGARYTVMVNGGRTALRDLANNPARDTQWSFRIR